MTTTFEINAYFNNTQFVLNGDDTFLDTSRGAQGREYRNEAEARATFAWAVENLASEFTNPAARQPVRFELVQHSFDDEGEVVAETLIAA